MEKAELECRRVEEDKLQMILDMHHHEFRSKVFDTFREEIFHQQYAYTRKMERDLTMKRWSRLAEIGYWNETLTANSDEGRMRYDALVECMAALDHSLEVKTGVHYGLFGASVSRLGSDEQAKKYVPLIESCEMIGCFGLTELGHGSNVRGSNVRGIETTATFDAVQNGFILNTPRESAQKYWIGAAADTARWCAVFAHLITRGKSHGVHAFLVRIRDDISLVESDRSKHNLFKYSGGPVARGITIADVGDKVGLQGVDNGRLWFNHVFVPRENLLSRFGRVDENGTYFSELKSSSERFARQLGALTGGRVSIATGALINSKIGLMTAIRYAYSRRAFGPPGSIEVQLMFYQSHQLGLLPYLAKTYVMCFAQNRLKRLWWKCATQGVTKEVHVLSSGFKSLFSWHMRDCLQQCRELCGGQGYKSENRIAPIKNDRDVMMTFEGANPVLLQQVARALLDSMVSENAGRTKNSSSTSLSALGVVTDLQSLEADTKLLQEQKSIVSKEIDLNVWIENALRVRVGALLNRLSSDLSGEMKTAGQGFNAWNQCLDLAAHTARAYIDLVLYVWFMDDLRSFNTLHTSTLDALQMCATLFGLDVIESSATFLRLGCISASQADQVSTLRIQYASKLAPYSLSLTNAFGIPNHLLGPIANDWLSHYSREQLSKL
eukprot:CAMPEP_0182452432 /NCGR_PEP_ID=MMETSP1172-20130603/44246_1 /TAXON_ID=708627 /ORGANISM="Timspurckia oligopyrenoides, Strain CCMP3278" /LENGTH=665 /DNA_ID=CAMNT_0024650265 /DNA_START=12 /DNA_END=2009 /DNA_ORIENTATION=+